MMKTITIKDKRYDGKKALLIKIKKTEKGFDVVTSSLLTDILELWVDGKKILLGSPK